MLVAAIEWTWGLFPDSEYIYASYGQSLSEEKVSIIREDINLNAYRKIYVPSPLTVIRSDVIRNQVGGAIRAVGVGGSISGFGAGKKRAGPAGFIGIDDSLKPQDALSNNERNKVNYWYTNTLKSRKNSAKTPIILIQQRVHLNDLVGHIKAMEPEEWHFLEIPAINEITGEVLWEEAISKKDLMKLKEIDPFTFYSQYQQKPIVLGGQVIKTEWFQYYTCLPRDIDVVFLTADTAQKTKEHNDFSVFIAWALAGGKLHLLDGVRGKWEAPELETQAVNFWNRYKGGVNGRLPSYFYVEDKVSGTGLIQSLASKGLPMVGIQVEKDKLLRLKDVLGYIHAGQVLLPHSPNHGFNPQLLSEAESFRADMAHEHDDIVDCVVHGIKKAFAEFSVFDVL